MEEHLLLTPPNAVKYESLADFLKNTGPELLKNSVPLLSQRSHSLIQEPFPSKMIEEARIPPNALLQYNGEDDIVHQNTLKNARIGSEEFQEMKVKKPSNNKTVSFSESNQEIPQEPILPIRKKKVRHVQLQTNPSMTANLQVQTDMDWVANEAKYQEACLEVELVKKMMEEEKSRFDKLSSQAFRKIKELMMDKERMELEIRTLTSQLAALEAQFAVWTQQSPDLEDYSEEEIIIT